VRVPLGSETPIGADIQVYFDCTMQDDVACEKGDTEILLAHYTVGAADTLAPDPVASVAFTAPQNQAGTECFAVAGKQMIDVSVEIDDREPFTWIELVVQVAGEEVERTTRPIRPTGPLGGVMHVDEGAIDDEICVIATVHDASGNVAPAVQECVAADADAESRGCACSSAPQRGAAASLVGLLAVLVRRRARGG
jgi:MYXO-CTERM domain-containing protein